MIKMDLPKRKPQRLRGFDYSKANYYFVTICTDERKDLFGEIGKLNELLDKFPKSLWPYLIQRFLVSLSDKNGYIVEVLFL
jgi:hypothetical protein